MPFNEFHSWELSCFDVMQCPLRMLSRLWIYVDIYCLETLGPKLAPAFYPKPTPNASKENLGKSGPHPSLLPGNIHDKLNHSFSFSRVWRQTARQSVFAACISWIFNYVIFFSLGRMDSICLGKVCFDVERPFNTASLCGIINRRN